MAPSQCSRRARGFSVVELMVAMVIGMTVILGVTQVFSASFRANDQSLRYTALNQQLRATMLMMEREIRRAGFWAGTMRDFKTGSSSNPFAPLAAVSLHGDAVPDCFLFGYDADSSAELAADDHTTGEWRGFRLPDVNGSVEVKVGGGARSDILSADCAAGTWQTLTDPRVVQVTDLNFDVTNRRIVIDNHCPDAPEEVVIYVRDVQITLGGQLTFDPGVTRLLDTVVRVRNDQLAVENMSGGCA